MRNHLLPSHYGGSVKMHPVDCPEGVCPCSRTRDEVAWDVKSIAASLGNWWGGFLVAGLLALDEVQHGLEMEQPDPLVRA
jgi:hypothetical protein